MLIKRIRLVNFRSFLDREFIFTDGLNLLVGPNGAGKSTVFEAIGTVVFNSPKTSLKDAISKGKDYGSIYLEFDDYKVRRSFGSLIEYVLETPEGRYEGKETVISKLSQLLGIPNLESFWYDVLTIKQFAKLRPFDGTPNERLLLFGRILGIERYEQEFNYLKDVLSYGKKLLDQTEAEIELTTAFNERQEQYNQTVRTEKERLPDLYKKLAEARTRLSKAEDASQRMKHLIEAQAVRTHLLGYLEQLELKALIPAGNKREYERVLSKYNAEIAQYRIDQGRIANQRESIDKKIAYLKKIQAKCPVCGGPLSVDQRDQMIAELQTERNELREPVMPPPPPDRPQRWDDDGLEQEIERVKTTLREQPPIPELPTANDLTELAREVANLSQTVDTILKLEEGELKDLGESRNTLKLYRDAYDQIELYRKGVKDKISTIPVEARRVISNKANSLYQNFMEGHHEVSLTLDSSYGIIATIRGQEVPFASLGGAESVTAALAVRLAIAHYLARDLNLLFLDEATDALDKTAQEQMVRIVEELEGQVFVITHENVFTKGNVVEI